MTIKYTWNISQLERNSSNGFVITAHYRVLAEENSLHTSTYGTVGWSETSPDFTAFEDLTEEIVIGWVQEKLDKKTIETMLATQLEALKNPPIIPGLPWNILPAPVQSVDTTAAAPVTSAATPATPDTTTPATK